MSKQKFHLFFSAKQAEAINRTRRGDVYYQREDGTIVNVTQVEAVAEGESIPHSNWDDAEYLGVGTYHSGKSTSLFARSE